ncbi:MAG: O-methyltransferase [Clostridia bacterium]|nr:O-methyltransferase [Clostridia bacterium]
MVDNNKIEVIRLKARENYVPILQDVSLEFIEKILEERKPKTILEVGTAVGYSALCFSRHLSEGGKIITIELNEEMVKIARENIKDNAMENVIEVVHSDAYEYMKTLDEKFDVVFIDAAKGQYMKYLDEAMRLTKSGSIIIADNVLFKGRVLGEYNEHKHRTAVNRLREYLKRIEEDERLDSALYDIGDGIAVSYVK